MKFVEQYAKRNVKTLSLQFTFRRVQELAFRLFPE